MTESGSWLNGEPLKLPPTPLHASEPDFFIPESVLSLYDDAAFNTETLKALFNLRARKRADRLDRAATREAIPRPFTFGEYVNLPRPDEPFRIQGLLRAGARVIWSAPAKAGKSTGRDELVASLVNADRFLGEFLTAKPDGNAVVLDFENPRGESQERMAKLGVDDGALIFELIGLGSSFDILDRSCRAEWAAMLREHNTSILIVDTMSAVMESLGLDERTETRKFLVPLDQLKVEAGISEVIVLHHFGHTAERSRGDSFARGWPDHEWLTLWDGHDKSPRRFKTGLMRNGFVVPERALILDDATRRITLGEAKQPSVKAESAAVDEVWADIVALFSSNPLMSKNGVEKLLGEQYAAAGKGKRQTDIRDALKYAEAPQQRWLVKDEPTGKYRLSAAGARGAAHEGEI